MDERVRINPVVAGIMNERKERVGHNKENRFIKEIYKRPFYECLKIEMEEDFILADFFKKLDGYVQRVRRLRGSQYEREAKKTAEMVERLAKKQQELASRIKGKGITMLEFSNGYRLNDFELGTEFTFQDIDHNYSNIFNGLRVTKEMLQNPNDTTFEDKLKEEQDKNVERRKRIAELKAEYRSKRFPLMFTSKGRSELEELRNNIGQLEFAIKGEDNRAKDLETWNGFSPDDRALMVDYLEVTSSVNKGIDVIRGLVKKFEREIPKRNDPTVIHEALGRMVQDGMTEEDFRTIFEKIEAVALKRDAGVYGRKYISGDRRDTLVDGFVMNVFDVDGKLKREKEDSEREKTEKKVREEKVRV